MCFGVLCRTFDFHSPNLFIQCDIIHATDVHDVPILVYLLLPLHPMFIQHGRRVKQGTVRDQHVRFKPWLNPTDSIFGTDHGGRHFS